MCCVQDLAQITQMLRDHTLTTSNNDSAPDHLGRGIPISTKKQPIEGDDLCQEG